LKQKPHCVLVSGVGAVIGYGVIKSLRMSRLPLRIIGIDTDPRAVGFRFADLGLRCPFVRSKGYYDFLARLCRRERVSLIIPAIEQDVEFHMRRGEELRRETGTAISLNTLGAYTIARDKWETYRFLVRNRIPTPRTALLGEEGRGIGSFRFPLLIKPRMGQSGKGIVRIETREEMEYWGRKSLGCILQEHIGREEEEYTAGVFGKGDGRFAGPIVLKRKLLYGSTFEAEINEFPRVSSVVERVAKSLKPVGPTNIQVRVDRGVAKVLEINPRVSSSCSIKAAFGFNEPEMSVRFFVLGRKDFRPKPKKGIAVRYIEDLISIDRRRPS